MTRTVTLRRLSALAAMLAMTVIPQVGHSACCYFSAKNADILQPAQKVFITWDPVKQMETFTVQPKFEGNALDFGMVIPTPSQPKLHEMPRDFFKHLAVYSILKKREFAHSELLRRRACRLRLKVARSFDAASSMAAKRTDRSVASQARDQGSGSRRSRFARLQNHRSGPRR